MGRPTVGVAFGGGSARGIAHVGVIRWLEEHRIPIDVAAGTLRLREITEDRQEFRGELRCSSR